VTKADETEGLVLEHLRHIRQLIGNIERDKQERIEKAL
jgi:hypothetical protein